MMNVFLFSFVFFYCAVSRETWYFKGGGKNKGILGASFFGDGDYADDVWPGTRKSFGSWKVKDQYGHNGIFIYGGDGIFVAGRHELTSAELWYYNMTRLQWKHVGDFLDPAYDYSGSPSNRFGTVYSDTQYNDLNKPGFRELLFHSTVTIGDDEIILHGGLNHAGSASSNHANIFSYKMSLNQWRWFGRGKHEDCGDESTWYNQRHSGIGNFHEDNLFGGLREPCMESNGTHLVFAFGWLSGYYYSDVYLFDLETMMYAKWAGTGIGNQKGLYVDQGMFSAGSRPGGRKTATSWRVDNDVICFFGGLGFGSVGGGDNGYLGDLWAFSLSQGLWKWIGGSTTYTLSFVASTTYPTHRRYACADSDDSGIGILTGGYMNSKNIQDLWFYEYPTDTWTKETLFGDSLDCDPEYTVINTQKRIDPTKLPTLGGRSHGTAKVFKDEFGNHQVLFFGGSRNWGYLNDQFLYLRLTDHLSYLGGTDPNDLKGFATNIADFNPDNYPGRRKAGALFTYQDKYVVQFGGYSVWKGNTGYVKQYHEVWMYSPDLEQWKLLSGTGEDNHLGSMASFEYEDIQIPRGRSIFGSYLVNEEEFIVFGGRVLTIGYEYGSCNDIVSFHIGKQMWKRVWGSCPKTEGPAFTRDEGDYGDKGEFSSSTKPEGRFGSSIIQTEEEDIYIFFGGSRDEGMMGMGSVAANSVFLFNSSRNEWAWIYGTQCHPSSADPDENAIANHGDFDPGNIPAARHAPACWNLKERGEVFFFGGSLEDDGQLFSDFWIYSIEKNEWRFAGGKIEREYNTNPGHGIPRGRFLPAHAQVSETMFLILGGQTSDTSYPRVALGDLWMIELSGYTANYTLLSDDDVADEQGLNGKVLIYYDGETAHPGMLSGAMMSYVPSEEMIYVFGGSQGEFSSRNQLWKAYFGKYLCPDNLYETRSAVCSGRGSCLNDVCVCWDDSTHSGDYCQHFLCHGDPNPETQCHQNGECIGKDYCLCDNEWFEKDCSVPKCFGVLNTSDSVCSGNGKCFFPSNCTCHDYFQGEQCDVCDIDHFCSSRASSCASLKGLVLCNCDDGWSGKNCSIPTCFSKSSLSNEVCSSNGDCISNDTCVCRNYEEYKGNECQYPICYNLTEAEGACFGNDCVAPETCKCDNDLFDPSFPSLCSTPLCFGKGVDDENVCSGYPCIGGDLCNCSKSSEDEFLVFGKNCESKVGGKVIRSLSTLLKFHYSLLIEELSSIHGLEVGEKFGCERVIKDGTTSRGFVECSFSSQKEEQVSKEYVFFLDIRIDPIRFNREELVIFGIDNAAENELQGVGTFSVHPKLLHTKLTLFSFSASTTSSAVGSEEVQQTMCKDKLKTEDEPCVSVFSCIPETLEAGGTKRFQLGYVPDTSSTRYTMAKFYFTSNVTCKSDTPMDFIQFLPVTCSGSSKGDNFIAYPYCSSDVFQGEAILGVGGYMMVSLIPFFIIIAVIAVLGLFAIVNVGSRCTNKDKVLKESLDKEEAEMIQLVKKLTSTKNYSKGELRKRKCNVVFLPLRVLQSLVMILFVLVLDGINMYLATREFLTNSDVDQTNSNLVILKTTLSINEYIIYGSLGLYMFVQLSMILVVVGRNVVDPFFFCIAFGVLKEWVVYRVTKGVFLCWFICINLYCYIVKFAYSGEDEQYVMRSDFWWYFSIFVPEFLLVNELLSLLSFNGVSSVSYVRILRRMRFKDLWMFPKVRIGWGKSFNVDGILEEFIQLISISTTSENRKTFQESFEYGHHAWEMLGSLSDHDIEKYKLLFFPDVDQLRREGYNDIIQHHRMTSWKWVSTFFSLRCCENRRRKRIVPSRITKIAQLDPSSVETSVELEERKEKETYVLEETEQINKEREKTVGEETNTFVETIELEDKETKRDTTSSDFDQESEERRKDGDEQEITGETLEEENKETRTISGSRRGSDSIILLKKKKKTEGKAELQIRSTFSFSL